LKPGKTASAIFETTCQVPKSRFISAREQAGITGNGYRRIRGFSEPDDILSLVEEETIEFW
jgi:hypothetical protein